jgi:hypothetical protein
MAMEGYFHQQVCPHIDKHTKNDKMHVDKNPVAPFLTNQTKHASLPRKGLVKWKNSYKFLLFDFISPLIGNYLLPIGHYFQESLINLTLHSQPTHKR